MAERCADCVKLSDTGSEKSRLGVPRSLPLVKMDFKLIVSSRVKFAAHSEILESRRRPLVVKWISRNRCMHHHRVAVLVDAKVVLGAATKGR